MFMSWPGMSWPCHDIVWNGIWHDIRHATGQQHPTNKIRLRVICLSIHRLVHEYVPGTSLEEVSQSRIHTLNLPHAALENDIVPYSCERFRLYVAQLLPSVCLCVVSLCVLCLVLCCVFVCIVCFSVCLYCLCACVCLCVGVSCALYCLRAYVCFLVHVSVPRVLCVCV